MMKAWLTVLSWLITKNIAAPAQGEAMVGHYVWILMALSVANGSAALAQQAQGINQAVPEIAVLEPEL